MRGKIKSVAKLTGKILLWSAGILITLIIGLILLLRNPGVQSKIISKLNAYLQEKTKAEISVGSIQVSFPELISLKNVFVKDLAKDTLLYAGEVRVDPDFFALLRKNINLHYVSLKNTVLTVKRDQHDSLYNFDFLIASFSNKKPNEKQTPSGEVNFSIEAVNLTHIRFLYDDKYDGVYLAARLNNLDVSLDELDLQNQNYAINEFAINGLNTSIIISGEAAAPREKTKERLPFISANNIVIKNSSLDYTNEIQEQKITSEIYNMRSTKNVLDLNENKISIDQTFLNNSAVSIKIRDNKTGQDTLINTESDNNWTVDAGEVSLDKNNFSFNKTNHPDTVLGFNPNHLSYAGVALHARNIHYSPELIKVNISGFSAKNPEHIAVTQMSTDFIMTKKEISAAKFFLSTSRSFINADIQLNFPENKISFDSVSNMGISAQLEKTKIHTADILYFFPELADSPFFRHKNNLTSISGTISGKTSDLKVNNLKITTAGNTKLLSSFYIKGLPDIQQCFLNVPSLAINTGSEDIAALGGNLIPKNIHLPREISLRSKFKGKLKNFSASLNLKSDFGDLIATGTLSPNEDFEAKLDAEKFDLGKLLNNREMFGPVSASAKIKGNGLDTQNVTADIDLKATEFYFNKYVYHEFHASGKVTNRKFDGKMSLNDENAEFDLSGMVDLDPGKEQYRINLQLKGADLEKLNLTKGDYQIALNATADIKGRDMHTVNGTAGITHIIVSHHGKKYVLDSLLAALINQENKSEFSIKSAIVGVKYSGTFAPIDLVKELKNTLNNYFPLNDTTLNKSTPKEQEFDFEVKLNNHPLLSEVFLPGLKELEAGPITGSFNGKTSELKLTVPVKTLVYENNEIHDFLFTAGSNTKELNYEIKTSRVAANGIELNNFLADGKIMDGQIFSGISSLNDKGEKKLSLRSVLGSEKNNYRLAIDPSEFILMYERWKISPDNYMLFGKEGFMVHNFKMSKGQSNLSAVSENQSMNDDIKIEMNNFRLEDISKIVESDTVFLKGTMNGNVFLKRTGDSYGIVSGITVSGLSFREVPVGNLDFKSWNRTPGIFNAEARLTGEGNDLLFNGSYSPGEPDGDLDLNLKLKNISAKTIEAFSFGELSECEGSISGNLAVKGNLKNPEINGSLSFHQAYFNPAIIGSRLHINEQTIKISGNALSFNSFKISDKNDHESLIDGQLKIEEFNKFGFALNIRTSDFLLLNTTVKNNPGYYGRLIMDSRIQLKGTNQRPVISAGIKLKKGSAFTFAVTEKELTTSKGENVVVFVDTLKFHRILTRDEKKSRQKSQWTTFDISSTIEIDKNASLKLLLDSRSSDSLVVKGVGALSFALDPGGKASLTGIYNLTEGSYHVSLENLAKKKFTLQPGSSITWNGDPLNAEINITAAYSIRASPIDLVADQLPETEKAGFRQRYPFLVILKLKGALLKPEINFEIQLPPEHRGAMDGVINARVQQLNENPSSLNKQVFALLVLNRFIQENPLQTETDPVSGAARTTVSKFLSAQLNQLSSKVVPGVDISFDVQSYDDYSAGKVQGRTEVDVGISKQLFNERLTVQLGGSVDVEGERADQKKGTDIAGDAIVEYKLTQDGRYRLKGFRNNQYAGAIEGQIIETGAGLLFVRDFNKWRELFCKKLNKPKGIDEKKDTYK